MRMDFYMGREKTLTCDHADRSVEVDRWAID